MPHSASSKRSAHGGAAWPINVLFRIRPFPGDRPKIVAGLDRVYGQSLGSITVRCAKSAVAASILGQSVQPRKGEDQKRTFPLERYVVDRAPPGQKGLFQHLVWVSSDGNAVLHHMSFILAFGRTPRLTGTVPHVRKIYHRRTPNKSAMQRDGRQPC
mmetsp:Transcript_23292/g.40291  ORF Transcript_23292/g.40291 Transcript_23292/m.40291 type:complete len:157 (+) Transcript_23292:1626-2096(+)